MKIFFIILKWELTIINRNINMKKGSLRSILENKYSKDLRLFPGLYRTLIYSATSSHRLRCIAECCTPKLLLVARLVALRRTVVVQPLGASSSNPTASKAVLSNMYFRYSCEEIIYKYGKIS